MNATTLALLARDRNRVVAAVGALAFAALLATACTHSVLGGSESKPNCAQLVASAFASPNVPVAGAYACLAPTIQAEAAKLTPSVTDDASLAAYSATDPVLSAVTPKGAKFDSATSKLWYYFEFTPGPMCWRAHLDSSGHVDAGAWKNGSCLPLP